MKNTIRYHVANDVREEQTENTQEQQAMLATEEQAQYAGKESDAKITKYLWLADSGSSYHFTNNDKGMMDVEAINEKVKIGNGKYMTATKKGILHTHVIQWTGRKIPVTMEVKYVPELYVNLFSIGASLKKGWQIKNWQ